jgi:hypothetical protein
MASIKNEMVRIAENFFTSQIQAHRNSSFPHTPNTPNAIPANKVSLPRRIYILLRNGRPLETFTDPDTADYEMHLCIQGDEYESARQGDDTPMTSNTYEIVESRLCYANINNHNQGE